MPESNPQKIVEYIRAHWPSKVKPEWQVKDGEYGRIVKKVVEEWSEGVEVGRKFLRVAGQSGSGKTTQLLPVAERMMPNAVLMAARKFVKYHPHMQEIEEEYGRENLRSMTNEFTTIMMFLTLTEIMARGYNIILDVTLLDVLVEKMIVNTLRDAKYESRMMIMAVSREISDNFIEKRAGRNVEKATADEFWRAQNMAVRWYAENLREMRVIVWSAFDLYPVYDGGFGGSIETFEQYWSIKSMPDNAPDENELLLAKLDWLKTA